MRKLVTAFVFTAVVLAGAATAQGVRPPVSFQPTEAISSSCAELAEKGVRIPFRNETAARSKVRIGLVLTRADGRQVRAKAVCGGIRFSPRRLVLRPGAGGATTLRAENATAKGTFNGSVAIFGRKGRVARRELTITNEPAAPAGPAVTPLVSSLSAAIDTDDEGPLWVPVKGSRSELPPAAKGEEGQAVVGVLTGPGGPVAVSYSGESEPLAAGISKVGLDIDEGLSSGAYSGKVDLAPGDDEAGSLDLALEVSEPLIMALVPLVAGILLGIFLLRGSGRMVPAARLRARVTGLGTRYNDAIAGLTRGRGGKSWQGVEFGDLSKLQEDFLAQIKEAKKKVAVKIEPKTIENVEGAIAVVEAQIDLLKEIPEHALEVEKALQIPRAVQLPELEDDHDQKRPRLDLEVEKTIELGEMEADQLKSQLEKMDTGAAQVRDLRGLEASLEEVWMARKGLKRGDLSDLDSHLQDCRRTLWILKDATGLNRARDQIQKAWEEVVALRGKQAPAAESSPMVPMVGAFASWAADKQLMTPRAATRLVAAAEAQSAPVPLSRSALAPEPVATLQPTRLPPPPLTKDDSRQAVWRALLMQLFVVLAAAAVALVSGLELFYEGNTWGSDWDYVTAFFWGVGAQALVTTLATSMDEFNGLRWLRRGR